MLDLDLDVDALCQLALGWFLLLAVAVPNFLPSLAEATAAADAGAATCALIGTSLFFTFLLGLLDKIDRAVVRA